VAEVKRSGSWRKMIGAIALSVFSFCVGTVFTPEVQPIIYDFKDRIFGCYAPFEKANSEWKALGSGPINRLEASLPA
jgi:hypothetical protein